MAATPKNKITSVERGKRRAGQWRSLTKKNLPAATPLLHRRGLAAQIKQQLGIKTDAK